MARQSKIAKVQGLEAAAMNVKETAEFWDLREGSLTLDDVVAKGLNPTKFASPVELWLR